MGTWKFKKAKFHRRQQFWNEDMFPIFRSGGYFIVFPLPTFSRNLTTYYSMHVFDSAAYNSWFNETELENDENGHFYTKCWEKVSDYTSEHLQFQNFLGRGGDPGPRICHSSGTARFAHLVRQRSRPHFWEPVDAFANFSPKMTYIISFAKTCVSPWSVSVASLTRCA